MKKSFGARFWLEARCLPEVDHTLAHVTVSFFLSSSSSVMAWSRGCLILLTARMPSAARGIINTEIVPSLGAWTVCSISTSWPPSIGVVGFCVLLLVVMGVDLLSISDEGSGIMLVDEGSGVIVLLVDGG